MDNHLIPFPSTAKPASRLGVLALVLGLSAVVVIHFDVPLFVFALRSWFRGDARRALDLAETFAFGPAAVVIALGVAIADQRGLKLTHRLFAYPVVSGLMANLFKMGIPRLRPRCLAELETWQKAAPTGWDTFFLTRTTADAVQLGAGSNSNWQSFPSAHAATAVGLAIGLARLYPRARWYFFTIAFLACYQRVYANAHYPSDVLAGAAVATMCCWLLERKASWSLAIPDAPGVSRAAPDVSASRAA